MKKHKENQIIYAFITGFRYVEPVAAPIEKRDSPKPRIQLVCISALEKST